MHCKNPTEEVLMWILMYADDISLACDTAEKLREAVITMDATFLRWGLTISTKKTKVLVVGRNAAAQAADSVITMRGDPLEVVSHFKYLGSVFTSDCTLDVEITHRVAAANSAFQQLRRANIRSSRALTLSVKMQFFQCIVMSVLLYSGETWAVVKKTKTFTPFGVPRCKPEATLVPETGVAAAQHIQFPGFACTYLTCRQLIRIVVWIPNSEKPGIELPTDCLRGSRLTTG